MDWFSFYVRKETENPRKGWPIWPKFLETNEKIEEKKTNLEIKTNLVSLRKVGGVRPSRSHLIFQNCFLPIFRWGLGAFIPFTKVGNIKRRELNGGRFVSGQK